MPNDIGNRPAAPMVTEDQGMNRRVRLTVRLGPNMHDRGRYEQGPAHGVRAMCAWPVGTKRDARKCERASVTASNDRKARDRTASEGTRFDVSVDADGARHLPARSADV
jgi:hypothetical protein